MIRRLLIHLSLTIPAGRFQPYLIGLAIGRMPRKVEWDEDAWRERNKPASK